MFGHFKEKVNKVKKVLSGEKEPTAEEIQARENKERQDMDQRVNQQIQSSKENRNKSRQEGRAYAEDVLSRNVQGLTPEQKNAMQYEANQQIKRATQSANRRLLGEQGMHGISGKSGVAYAQQRDLQRLANEARGQSQRDIDKLNADQRLKNLAAMFNIEQGEASQAQLDRQLALDELQIEQERKKQKNYEDQFNRLFSRI